MPFDETEKKERIEIGFEPEQQSLTLFVNIDFFVSALKAYYDAVSIRERKSEIQKILTYKDWVEHYRDKKTNRRVLSESLHLEYDHERLTAICLAQANYDVVFAPKGMFHRDNKKFDVYLLRDIVVLQADLKYISSKSPDTIAKRIIGGSEQAPRLVLDIRSDIGSPELIDGLRSGVEKSKALKEIFLFYKNKFYVLARNLILSKRIYNILKSKKGYT